MPCASVPITAFRLERRVEAVVDSLAKMKRFKSGGLHPTQGFVREVVVKSHQLASVLMGSKLTGSGWAWTMQERCCCVLSFHLLHHSAAAPPAIHPVGFLVPYILNDVHNCQARVVCAVTTSVDLSIPLPKPLRNLHRMRLCQKVPCRDYLTKPVVVAFRQSVGVNKSRGQNCEQPSIRW